MAIALSCVATKAQTLNLSGEWEVVLPGEAKDGIIRLPGTTDLAGYGVPTDTASLTRDEQFRRLTRRNSFVGKAVYTRVIDIPKSMAYKPLELSLERVLWKSNARIDGLALQNTEYSLVAPHKHILMDGLAPGKHTLEIEVDNTRQYDISTNNLAHAYTNDTQIMWNGVLGDMTLRVLPDCDIKGIDVYPSADLQCVRVVVKIDNYGKKPVSKVVTFSLPGQNQQSKCKMRLQPGMNTVEATLPAGSLIHWSEFTPQLYSAKVEVDKDSAKEAQFGMRTVDNKDGIRVNGTPIFLRGTLECCVFPLTGMPPTDKAGWAKTFGVAKEWGLNHLRFHSWCPPEAAFEVADSLGFYVQVELPVWSLKIGDDAAAEQFLKDEYERIVQAYGNHPSFLMMSVGNELQHDFDWLNAMVSEMKARDPRHLYTTTSFTFEKGHGGHPEPQDEFFVTQWTDDGWVRGQGIFETERPTFNKNYSSALKRFSTPLVSHEIGQYAVYPSMDEIAKYTGVLNPLNFKNIYRDLEEKGMLGQSREMTLASGKLAALLYKEEIERVLKTPGMSGFQLLGLQDFPGQGTALVGLIDAFWDNKGAVEADWFRQFNSPVVPLLNYDEAVYSTSSNFTADILIANYSGHDLRGGNIDWSLTIEGDKRPLSTGTVYFDNILAGSTKEVGSFTTSLLSVANPSSVIVKLGMPTGEVNSWRIFVYPKAEINSGDVICTQSLTEALQALEMGKTVLFSPRLDDMAGLESKFLPVFWSPVHFPKQAGTMGIMNGPDHPALSGFPNGGHTDWQWWRPVKNAKVINIDSIANVEPIVSVIDNFVSNRKLAYIFEAKCGNGKLLFTAIDVLGPASDCLELTALRASLLDYLNSDKFAPKATIAPAVLETLVPGNVESKYTKATDIYD